MQKRSAILLLSVIFFSGSIRAQTLRRPVSANYVGLGAYSLLQNDLFSFTANPAALAQMKSASAGVFGERRFLQNELNNYIAALGLTTQSGNFGVNANYFGFSDYNESRIGLAYGRNLGTKLDIGAQFNYHSIRIAGYGNSSAISFQLGAVMHLTDRLHTGFHVANPVGGKFGKDDEEKLPSQYTLGVGYDASQKFFVSAEIEKEESQPVNVNAALQYKFLPELMARVGMSSATSSAWVGLGLMLKSFRIDLTTSYHPQLGITPGLLLLFNFNAKSN